MAKSSANSTLEKENIDLVTVEYPQGEKVLEGPKLLHYTKKQLVFDTEHLKGKTIAVSINFGEPVRKQIVDDITIVTINVPESFRLNTEVV